MFQPIRAGRLYEQIVERIEQQVLNGELNAGDRLPPERLLAEQFGVSRTAVREAVKALRQRGLIEVYPGRGTFVTDGTSNALHRSLGLAMRVGQGDGVESLLELREIIEPAITAKAAMFATDEQIEQLEKLVDQMDAYLNVPNKFMTADNSFHMVIAAASGNSLVPTILNSIVDILQEQRSMIFRADGGQWIAQEHHRNILNAIKNRQPEIAQKSMEDHLAQVRADYESAIRR